MVLRYLVVGPVSAAIGFFTFLLLGGSILLSLVLAWVVGCAAVAVLVALQLTTSEAEADVSELTDALGTGSVADGNDQSLI